jgi:hypothetical protein
MIDELSRLKPLSNASDNEQRQRAVAFVVAELEAGNQDQCAINMSGSRVGTDNYLSIVMGMKRSESSWHLNKTNLPPRLSPGSLAAHLRSLSLTGQTSRAALFAASELDTCTEAGGSVNMSGNHEIGFLSLSVSAAD